jgi:hypothetical protein
MYWNPVVETATPAPHDQETNNTGLRGLQAIEGSLMLRACTIQNRHCARTSLDCYRVGVSGVSRSHFQLDPAAASALGPLGRPSH